MTTSNLDLARECGARIFKAWDCEEIQRVSMTPDQLDAFADRIRADALAVSQPSPAAVERKPMTTAEIEQMAEDGDFLGNVYEIVRAIEKAHGITAQQGGKPLTAHFTPFYLLANARRICATKYQREPNWVIAKTLFAVGSTTAARLCREAGIDPDAFEVRKVGITAQQGGDA